MGGGGLGGVAAGERPGGEAQAGGILCEKNLQKNSQFVQKLAEY